MDKHRSFGRRIHGAVVGQCAHSARRALPIGSVIAVVANADEWLHFLWGALGFEVTLSGQLEHAVDGVRYVRLSRHREAQIEGYRLAAAVSVHPIAEWGCATKPIIERATPEMQIIAGERFHTFGDLADVVRASRRAQRGSDGPRAPLNPHLPISRHSKSGYPLRLNEDVLAAADRIFGPAQSTTGTRIIKDRAQARIRFFDLVPEGQTPGDVMMTGEPLGLDDLIELPIGSIVLAARGRQFSTWGKFVVNGFRRTDCADDILMARQLLSGRRVVVLRRAPMHVTRGSATSAPERIEPCPSADADHKPLLDAGEMTRLGWSSYVD